MSNWMVSYNNDDILHYGVKGRSGRKPGFGNKKSPKTVYRKEGQRENRFGISGRKQKSGAAQVMTILKLKNVSDQRKMAALYKLYKSGVKIDEKELRKYLKNNPKMYQYLQELKAGKVSKPKATVTTNKPKINSAYDARNYRVQQLYKKKEALTNKKI